MRALAIGLSLIAAASAGTIPVQVTGIQGGFTTGCAGNGCGGMFDTEIGGTEDASGDLTGGTTVFAYCIDAQNSVYIPSTVYEANLTPITTGADLSNTRYGRDESQWTGGGDPGLPIDFRTTTFAVSGTDSLTPTALERYQMEAWLVSEYAVLPSSDRAAIQDAIWQVTDVIPPAGEQGNYLTPPDPGGAKGAEIANLVSDAADFVKYQGTDAFYSQFEIITNAGPLYLEGQDPAQELMAYTPTPEPASFAGAIAVLGGVLAWMRRKRARAAANVSGLG